MSFSFVSIFNSFCDYFIKIFNCSNLNFSWKFYFINPVTNIFEENIKIHNQIIILELIIFISIIWVLFYILYCFKVNYNNLYTVAYTKKIIQ